MPMVRLKSFKAFDLEVHAKNAGTHPETERAA